MKCHLASPGATQRSVQGAFTARLPSEQEELLLAAAALMQVTAGAVRCSLLLPLLLPRTPLLKIMKPTFLLIIFTSFFSCWCGSRQFSMLRLLGPALPEQNKLGAQVGSCPCGSYSSVPSASPSMGPLPLGQCGAARGKQQEGSIAALRLWGEQLSGLCRSCCLLRVLHCAHSTACSAPPLCDHLAFFPRVPRSWRSSGCEMAWTCMSMKSRWNTRRCRGSSLHCGRSTVHK